MVRAFTASCAAHHDVTIGGDLKEWHTGRFTKYEHRAILFCKYVTEVDVQRQPIVSCTHRCQRRKFRSNGAVIRALTSTKVCVALRDKSAEALNGVQPRGRHSMWNP